MIDDWKPWAQEFLFLLKEAENAEQGAGQQRNSGHNGTRGDQSGHQFKPRI